MFSFFIHMPPVISVEHLSKAYRLGQIGTGTFSRDLEVWWAKLRGNHSHLMMVRLGIGSGIMVSSPTMDPFRYAFLDAETILAIRYLVIPAKFPF